MHLEHELVEMQAENLRISQAVSQLEAAMRQREQETEERVEELSQSVETLTSEKAAMRGQMEKMTERFAQTKHTLETVRTTADEYSLQSEIELQSLGVKMKRQSREDWMML